MGVIILTTGLLFTAYIYPNILLALGAPGLLFTLLVIVVNGRGCVRYCRDMWLIKRWLRKNRGDVLGSELSRVYQVARTEYGRSALLERLQSRGVVKMDAASVERLMHLALYIDARLATEPLRPPRSTTQSRLGGFLQRLAAVADNTDWSRSKKYLSRQRDALYLILEVNRRSGLVEDAATADAGRPVATTSVEPAS